jgi:hypothetical protein
VADAGLEVPRLCSLMVCLYLRESAAFRFGRITLYVTMERRIARGTALPPMTELIQLSGITRVVIGSLPVGRRFVCQGRLTCTLPASASMGILFQECQELIEGYSIANIRQIAYAFPQNFGRYDFTARWSTRTIAETLPATATRSVLILVLPTYHFATLGPEIAPQKSSGRTVTIW